MGDGRAGYLVMEIWKCSCIVVKVIGRKEKVKQKNKWESAKKLQDAEDLLGKEDTLEKYIKIK